MIGGRDDRINAAAAEEDGNGEKLTAVGMVDLQGIRHGRLVATALGNTDEVVAAGYRQGVSFHDIERIRQLVDALGVTACQIAVLVADVDDDNVAFLGKFAAHIGLEC